MNSIEASEAAFTPDSERLFEALAEAEKFEKGETIRLSAFTTQLLHENDTLSGNLNSGSPNISTELLAILHSAPMKSLPTPSTALFDEIMPELAGCEIDYDDDFRHHEIYATIITAFRILQATENGGYMSFGEPGGKERWIPNVYDQGQMFNWALE